MSSLVDSSSFGQQEVSDEDRVPAEDVARCMNSVSSQSNLSNEISFYNACRASSTSGDDAGSKPDSRNEIHESLDSRMAANVAMFFPLSSEFKAPRPPWHDPGIPRSTHFASDNNLPSVTKEKRGGIQPRRQLEPQPCEQARQPRKAASFNDVHNLLRSPKWPENLRSPVSPALPRYPPPVRSPTPPGLPSFGAREAMSYVSQLADPASMASSGPQRPLPASRPRAASSYTDVVRRLFGLPSTTSPRNRQAPVPAIRADDGTTVHGRFPYRQSGHGMLVARGIDDHPFHRRNLSVAQCDGTEAGDPYTVSGEPATRDHGNTASRPSLPTTTINPEQVPGRYPQSVPNTSGSTGSGPPTAPPIPNFIPRRRDDSFHTCSSRAQENSVSRTPNDPQTPDPPSPEDPAECFLTATESTAVNTVQDKSAKLDDRPDSWLYFFKKISSLYCCCCLSPVTDPNNMTNENSNTSSCNDTYVTARAWNSTDSATGNANHVSGSGNSD